MENPGILKQHHLSPLKAAALGAICSTVITLTIFALSSNWRGRGDLAWFLLALDAVVLAPTALLSKLFGWNLTLAPDLTNLQKVLLVSLVCTVNSVIGAAASLLASMLSRSKRNSPPSK